MTQISTLSSFLGSVTLIDRSQTSLQTLNQQNATGKRSVSLEGYGSDAPRVLNLQVSITETETYQSNGKQVATYLTAYNDALSQLLTDAKKLKSGLDALQTGNSDKTANTNLQTLVQGLLTDVGATLNTTVGNRYIFAGNRYGTAPTVDLNQLGLPSSPSALTLASGSSTPPTVPAYDTDYATGTPPGTVSNGATYYGQQQVAIASNETLSYGVSADDPAIQQLVYALQQAGAGTTATGANATQFLGNASSALGQAIDNLTTLSQGNAANQATLSSNQDSLAQALGNLQSQQSDLTQVDSATVATELSSIETQLEGTYKATATLLDLSLLKYL